jgi:hypothetical protein
LDNLADYGCIVAAVFGNIDDFAIMNPVPYYIAKIMLWALEGTTLKPQVRRLWYINDFIIPT